MNQFDVPKMKTSAPLTPEQIRAIVGRHEAAKRRRRYIAIRSIVRVAFWTLVIAGVCWLAMKFNVMPDDYRDTCEALGKVCQP